MMAVLPSSSVVRLVSSSPAVPVPPMAAARVVVPLSRSVKLRAVPSDLTVLPSVMPAPVRVVSAPRVTASP